MRKLRDKFQKVEDAYLAKSPDDFRDASTAFLAAVRKLGPELGPYPAQQTIDLEVSYNHSAPFRAGLDLHLDRFALRGGKPAVEREIALPSFAGGLWRRAGGHVRRLRHAQSASRAGRR